MSPLPHDLGMKSDSSIDPLTWWPPLKSKFKCLGFVYEPSRFRLLFVEHAANWSVVGLGKRGLSEEFTAATKLERNTLQPGSWLIMLQVHLLSAATGYQALTSLLDENFEGKVASLSRDAIIGRSFSEIAFWWKRPKKWRFLDNLMWPLWCFAHLAFLSDMGNDSKINQS